ncbi:MULTISPECIES: hypothetical protein [unclassified Anaerobiospirillum]|nr:MULTISPECIES: hypothetical protein [unclassified Anaerobiospirillum]
MAHTSGRIGISQHMTMIVADTFISMIITVIQYICFVAIARMP